MRIQILIIGKKSFVGSSIYNFIKKSAESKRGEGNYIFGFFLKIVLFCAMEPILFHSFFYITGSC